MLIALKQKICLLPDIIKNNFNPERAGGRGELGERPKLAARGCDAPVAKDAGDP